MAKSALGSLVPLILLLLLVIVVGVVGFVAYTIAQDVAANTNKKMEKKNMTLSRDGLKVGVKEVSAEQVGDSTQSVLMKAWNASSWPAYKSKLGWGSGSPVSSPGVNTEKRKPFSRTTSAQSNKKA